MIALNYFVFYLQILNFSIIKSTIVSSNLEVMKKLFIAAFVVCSLSTYAQEGNFGPDQDPPRASRKAPKGERGEGRENRMLEDFKELNLSEKQQNQLKAYFEAEKAKMSQNRSRFGGDGEMPSASEMKAMREQIQTKMQEMDAKVKTILTEEQYVNWKAKQEARMKQFMGR